MLKDETKAALINLDQSKAFDRVDHRFLATVSETTVFKPEFRKWISIYHNPPAFVLKRSVRQGCPLSPLLYVLALEPLLRRFTDGTANPAPRGIFLSGCYREGFCVRRWYHCFCLSPIGHKDGEEGSWDVRRSRSAVRSEGVVSPCQDPYTEVTDPSTSSGCGSSPASNWSKIGWRYGPR